jgi:hypothetical protein
MTIINPYSSIITLKINGLNSSIKRIDGGWLSGSSGR